MEKMYSTEVDRLGQTECQRQVSKSVCFYSGPVGSYQPVLSPTLLLCLFGSCSTYGILVVIDLVLDKVQYSLLEDGGLVSHLVLPSSSLELSHSYFNNFGS